MASCTFLSLYRDIRAYIGGANTRIILISGLLMPSCPRLDPVHVLMFLLVINRPLYVGIDGIM